MRAEGAWAPGGVRGAAGAPQPPGSQPATS